MDNERRTFTNGSIAIQGSEIIDIGDTNELEYTADTVIDCTNKVILPGLINLHTHVPMSLFRGFADETSSHTSI